MTIIIYNIPAIVIVIIHSVRLPAVVNSDDAMCTEEVLLPTSPPQLLNFRGGGSTGRYTGPCHMVVVCFVIPSTHEYSGRQSTPFYTRTPFHLPGTAELQHIQPL